MNTALDRGRWINIATAGMTLGALVLAALLSRSGDGLQLGGTPLGGLCLSRELLGLPCPFCGMTRSFVALMHFDVAAALFFHPCGPLLLLAYAVTAALALERALRGGPALLYHPQFLRFLQLTAMVCVVLGTIRTVGELLL